MLRELLIINWSNERPAGIWIFCSFKPMAKQGKPWPFLGTFLWFRLTYFTDIHLFYKNLSYSEHLGLAQCARAKELWYFITYRTLSYKEEHLIIHQNIYRLFIRTQWSSSSHWHIRMVVLFYPYWSKISLFTNIL